MGEGEIWKEAQKMNRWKRKAHKISQGHYFHKQKMNKANKEFKMDIHKDVVMQRGESDWDVEIIPFVCARCDRSISKEREEEMGICKQCEKEHRNLVEIDKDIEYGDDPNKGYKGEY